MGISLILEVDSYQELTAIHEPDVDAVIAPVPQSFLDFSDRVKSLLPQQQKAFVSNTRANCSHLDKIDFGNDNEVQDCIEEHRRITLSMVDIFKMAVNPKRPHEVIQTNGYVGFLHGETARNQPWHTDKLQSLVMTWCVLANGTSCITSELSQKERETLIQKRELPQSPIETITLGPTQFLISKQEMHPGFNVETGLIHRAENLGLTRLSNLVATRNPS